MKRVPLLKKDYPVNFNKVAKYISKNWTEEKLSFEKSRALLASLLGYNSIHELEKSFVSSLPNLIDRESLLESIKLRMDLLYTEKVFSSTHFDLLHIQSLWKYYEKNTFPKIPFYLLEALDNSKENIFSGIYDKIASRMSLVIQPERSGQYYGLFLSYIDTANKIDLAVDHDKTYNLLFFFQDYECFPFGQGASHLSVITQLNERVEKYFNKDAQWKINVLDSDGNRLEYYEVLNIVLSWFNEASKNTSGTPWYVIDTKKREGHWLFASLDKAIKEFKENNYQEIVKKEDIPEKSISDSSLNKELKANKMVIVDESFKLIPNLDISSIRSNFSSSKQFKSKNKQTIYSYVDGSSLYIGDYFKTSDGTQYHLVQFSDTDNLYVYQKEKPFEIFDIAIFDKKVYKLNWGIQSLEDYN